MGCPFVSDYLNDSGYHILLCFYSLAEVSNQMLELYEQNRVPPSQGSEADGTAGGGTRAAAKASAVNEGQASTRAAPQNSSAENHEVPPTGTTNQSNDGSAEMGSVITDHKLDPEIRDTQHSKQLPQKDDQREVANGSNSEQIDAEDQDRMGGSKEAAEVQKRGDSASHKSSRITSQNFEHQEGLRGQTPKEAIKMIDKDKVKAALEKRRKARGEVTLKKDVMDEDDLIERELEDGVELAVEDEKNKWEKKQGGSKSRNADRGRGHEEIGDGQSQKEMEAEKAEEGEMTDDASFLSNNHKRKARSSPDGRLEEKKRLDLS